MQERKNDWHTIVRSIDPALEERVSAVTGHVLETESEIPQKYKELILMACAAAVRCGSETHKRGCEAMHYGASDKEIVEALALASLVSGTAAFREAIEVLEDQFTVDPVEDEAAR